MALSKIVEDSKPLSAADRKLRELFIFIGPQKAASSWLYLCLKEHPEISLPKNKNINYFDINYFRGDDWYFQTLNGGKIDISITYIKDPNTAKRIKDFSIRHNIKVKLYFIYREPVDRAISHLRYENMKKGLNLSDTSLLQNYDNYTMIIGPSCYEKFIKNYKKQGLPLNQIDYAQIKTNPEKVVSNLYNDLGVNPDFKPSVLNIKINRSQQVFVGQMFFRNKIKQLIHFLGLEELARKIRQNYFKLFSTNITSQKNKVDNELHKIISIMINNLRGDV